jgi:hypothetical protein
LPFGAGASFTSSIDSGLPLILNDLPITSFAMICEASS